MTLSFRSRVRARLTPVIRSRAALWIAFALVHIWLTFLGVGPLRTRTLGDVELYRQWAHSGFVHGMWTGIDSSWVYPIVAWVPILIPTLVSTVSPVFYTLGWCAFITLLDAIAVRVLIRVRAFGVSGLPDWHDASAPPRGHIAAWGWLAFLFALGPVAIGRLDSVIAPLMIVALVAARHHPRAASALLTIGAWIKVAPGALLIALATATRRPLRDVVLPAAAVSAAVVAVSAALGGLPYIATFMSDQGSRGLQVEAVGATPWMVGAMFTRSIRVVYNVRLVTFEIVGPGTTLAATVLGVLLVAVVVGLSVLLIVARRRGVDVLLPGSLVLMTTLIVTNKVGSPQYITWIAPAIAVAIATRALGPWLRLGALACGIAALTQWIYPWQYSFLLQGHALITTVLVLRNGALVALLIGALATVVRDIRQAPAVENAEESAPAAVLPSHS